MVDGRVLESAEAHGKHLFHHYGPDLVVHVHLGPVRQVLRRTGCPPRSRAARCGCGWSARPTTRDLRGPTACELLTDAEVDAIHARLGADPLRDDADPDRAWARISRSRAPLATLLMDQSVIAGVGNVYRAEALFRHGLDPQLPGRELDPDVLGRAVGRPRRPAARRRAARARSRRCGPSTTRAARHGRRPVRPHGRTSTSAPASPAWSAATPVAHARHLARNLFWCPVCQAPETGKPVRRAARRARS